jgi:hypothetical protein
MLIASYVKFEAAKSGELISDQVANFHTSLAIGHCQVPTFHWRYPIRCIFF